VKVWKVQVQNQFQNQVYIAISTMKVISTLLLKNKPPYHHRLSKLKKKTYPNNMLDFSILPMALFMDMVDYITFHTKKKNKNKKKLE
jgi:hypothetical protein